MLYIIEINQKLLHNRGKNDIIKALSKVNKLVR